MTTVPPLAVHLRLEQVRYLGGGEENAEPFLWVCFFKIDGDSAFLDEVQNLRGKATVMKPREPRTHGNLPPNVHPGDTLTIQPELGSYRTTLRGIPMRVPIGRDSVGGIVGYVLVLWEEDNTDGEAMSEGWVAFTNALQRELDALIPTLGIAKPKAAPEDIDALKDRISSEVKARIEVAILAPTALRFFFDPIGALINLDLDDQLGDMFETFDTTTLLSNGPAIPIHSGRDTIDAFGTKLDVSKLRGDGEWEITGKIVAIPFSLRSFFAVTKLNPLLGVRNLLAGLPRDPFAKPEPARSVKLLFENLI